jgi:hypothetical protein
MFSRWICIIAAGTTLAGSAWAQNSEQKSSSNMISGLPGYVRLLPKNLLAKRSLPAAKLGVPANQTPCAHMLFAPVTPDRDAGMLHRVDPRNYPMPLHPGLPHCPENRREPLRPLQ